MLVWHRGRSRVTQTRDTAVRRRLANTRHMPTRRWIYRENMPPVIVAVRLALNDDETFEVGEHIYAGDDTLEAEAIGRWRASGDFVVLTVTSSTCGFLPAGNEATLLVEAGAILHLGSHVFEPDMPRTYAGVQETGLGSLHVRLHLAPDGTFELTRRGELTRHGQDLASTVEETTHGEWALTRESIELQPHGENAACISLRRRADGGLDDEAAELRPVDD